MKKKILALLMTFTSLFLLTACSSTNQLNGTYHGQFELLGAKTTDTLKFDGDKVTEAATGGKAQTGTYTVDGERITIKFKQYQLTGDLAKDHKSFIITKANGLASVLKGTKYIREETK